MKYKLIEKLEELVDSFRNLSNRYYMWSSMPVIYKQDIDPLIDELESEIAQLKEEIEKEKSKDKFQIPEHKHLWMDGVCQDCGAISGLDVYTRPECPFNYCDDSAECKNLGICHHRI